MTERKTVIGEVFAKETKTAMWGEQTVLDGHFYEPDKGENAKETEAEEVKDDFAVIYSSAKDHKPFFTLTKLICVVSFIVAYMSILLLEFYGSHTLPFKVPRPRQAGDLCVTLTYPSDIADKIWTYSECSNGDKLSSLGSEYNILLRNETFYELKSREGVFICSNRSTPWDINRLLQPTNPLHKDRIKVQLPLTSQRFRDYFFGVGKENLVTITPALGELKYEESVNVFSPSPYDTTYREIFHPVITQEIFTEFLIFSRLLQSQFTGEDRYYEPPLLLKLLQIAVEEIPGRVETTMRIHAYDTPAPFLNDFLQERVEVCLQWGDGPYTRLCRSLLACQSRQDIKDIPCCSCAAIAVAKIRENLIHLCGACSENDSTACVCQTRAFVLYYGIQQHRCLEKKTLYYDTSLYWRDKNTNFVTLQNVTLTREKLVMYESVKAYMTELFTPDNKAL